jgi:mycoredoxin
MNSSITVYGTDWCGDTTRTRQHLDGLQVPYDYIDIEQDPVSQDWVKRKNGGKQRTPTVDVDGEILVEPEEGALDQALRDHGLLN